MISLLDLGFRFGTIAVLVLLGLLVLREKRAHLAASIVVAFALGLIAYLLCSAPFWATLPTWLRAVLTLGCLANPLLFWLLSQSIFADGFKLGARHVLMFVAIEALGLWYLFGLRSEQGSALETLAGTALRFVAVALIGAAIITAFRGRVPDLVESRRRFRTLFVSVAGTYMAFVALIEILLRGQTPHPIASLLNAGAIFVIVFGVAVSLLKLKFDLLLEPMHPTPAVALDALEQALMQRLDEAMANKLYRREGLTIGVLARELETQEHKLRALVNNKIGFRNFNDFLNHHRVTDACAQLADPTLAGTPVLTIALNLGYGSIGPFNRAFKQATGLTPTLYRRQKLEIASGAQAQDLTNSN